VRLWSEITYSTGQAYKVARTPDPHILKCVAMALVAFDIGKERAIVSFLNASEVCREIFCQCPGLPECLAVLFISKERKDPPPRGEPFPTAAPRFSHMRR